MNNVLGKFVEYSVMEKLASVASITWYIGFSNSGPRESPVALGTTEENGLCCKGNALPKNAIGYTTHSNNRLSGAFGANKAVIIDTPDAVLVAYKSSTQDVKHIYARHKLDGHKAYKHHHIVHRSWGTNTLLEEGPDSRPSSLKSSQVRCLALQMHHHRSEHWIVVDGMAKVVNGEQELSLNANQPTYIPASHQHRVENPDPLTIVMIEVQSGAQLREDDIVRFQDNYGRE